ncbi:MAG: fucose isomerase [Chloroflexi bacterium]|nr:fucose isomerase [Chloroflexota bacterium]
MTGKKPVLGVIIGNRGFFPDHLADTGRQEIQRILEAEGITPIMLTPQDSNFGSLETMADADKCAALFKAHREEIIGVLISLPNFGEERPIAAALRLSGLDVPVLVQATPDEPGKMTIADRRDSFCGKMSTCSNLTQHGIPFSLTRSHTVSPSSTEFLEDLRWFVSVCQVVAGLRGARIGCLGARPAAFTTVRYSEKLLEQAGISVETMDLSEAYGRMERLQADDLAVQAKLAAIQGYISAKGVPAAALVKMAKFGVVMDQWIKESKLVATAIQCWTSMEEFFGVVPCTVMSMMSNSLMPSACETDVTGAVGMYAMQLASGRPSALVDWNNNYASDPDKAVLFHCSNLPKDLFGEAKMDYQEIIAGTVGKENTYGTVVGQLKPGDFTFCRVSTEDTYGEIRAYVGEGQFTRDRLDTFGGYGVAEIPALQTLLRYICENGFEHHVAINISQTASAVTEALSKYMGWEVYLHNTL